ncbi:MAG: helix-turn-helix transcriptional regulator [Planctomycetes bacterium]|nr:helix-turn-helix transcriptional regulator [Planctomycetota bacterium]
MKVTVEEGDEQFLQQLHQAGGGTVQELCDAAGVTATAIRQRLTRLQALGFVERTTVRSGRGRPHHAYRVTDVGRQQFGDNYAELALLLWDELHGIEEPIVRERVTNRIREALVRRYGASVRGESLVQRLDELRSTLSDHGFRVEVDSRGLFPVLRETNCPYHELAQRDSGICELEQQVFEQVLGTPLKLASCCRDGHACCEFHPVPAG